MSPYFQSSDFGEEDKILLFGSTDSAVAFEQFDTDGDGEVKMHFRYFYQKVYRFSWVQLCESSLNQG